MKYIKATATFESGKKLTYEKTNIFDLMAMKMRILETETCRKKLRMDVDKLVSFNIEK